MFSRFLNCTNGAKTSHTFFSDKPNIYKHIHANALEKFAVIHQKVSKDDCQQLFNDQNLVAWWYSAKRLLWKLRRKNVWWNILVSQFSGRQVCGISEWLPLMRIAGTVWCIWFLNCSSRRQRLKATKLWQGCLNFKFSIRINM